MKQLILYCIILICLTIFSYVFVDSNQSYFHFLYTAFSTNYRGLTVTIFVLLLILLFVSYVFLFRSIIHLSHKQKRNYLICTILILILAYPGMLSFDIFGYITTAKVLYFYKENPYIIMPIAFVGDPYLLFTRFANTTTPYGPLWVLTSGVPYLLGLGFFPLILLNFKIITFCFLLGTGKLLEKMTNSRQALLFLLQPLILIEVLISSHNDIVMLFLAVLSLYFLRKKQILLGILFLLCSILIKYATIFLLPVYGYVVLQQLRKKEISWNNIYLLSAVSMFIIFLLSALRVEIYPWYAVWFLPFVYLNGQKRYIFSSLVLSLGLLLRYAPYMMFGEYVGMSQLIRIGIFIVFGIIACLFLLFGKNKLAKIPFLSKIKI